MTVSSKPGPFISLFPEAHHPRWEMLAESTSGVWVPHLLELYIYYSASQLHRRKAHKAWTLLTTSEYFVHLIFTFLKKRFTEKVKIFFQKQ